jgi:hypothetical protein
VRLGLAAFTSCVLAVGVTAVAAFPTAVAASPTALAISNPQAYRHPLLTLPAAGGPYGPGPGGVGGPGGAGTGRVARVTVRGPRVLVALRCAGNPGVRCALTLTLSAIDPLAHRRAIIGRKKQTLAGGRKKVVSVQLNAAGKRLLAQSGTLRARLTVAQAAKILSTRRIGLTRNG